MRRGPVIVSFALLAVVGSALRAGHGDGVGTRRRTTAAPPGVVLICLDTLRADALSLDSGRPILMPRLDAFARESVAFADAQAPAAWTLPSVATMLTGLEPARTGVFGLPERLRVMSAAVPTLADELSRAGWYTASLTSSEWLGPESSVLRGFGEGLVGLDRGPEELLDAWNRRRPSDAPFFLFLHSVAAHDPYLEDETGLDGARVRKRFGTDIVRIPEGTPSSGLSDDDVARVRRMALTIDAGALPPFDDLAFGFERYMASAASRARLMAALPRASGRAYLAAMRRWLEDDCGRDPKIAALAARLRGAYDASLADVDHMAGRILDGLARLDLPSGTAVIVVSDHGESFGEHETFGHGRRLYDELLRVPLIIHAPDRMGAPRVVRGPCGLIDVAPTILSLAGRARTSGFDGRSLVDARVTSLSDRALWAVDERLMFDDTGEHVVRLESIRTARAKCLVSRDPVDRSVLSADVYDLLLDPLERHPIPFASIDPPCRLGDEFAAALERAGLPVPCRREAAAHPAGATPGG